MHKLNVEGLDSELRRGLEARAAGVAGGGHPEPELLAAYDSGELAPEQESRVQEHLVWCRECTALLLGLEALSRPQGTDPPGAVAEEDWRSIQARLLAPRAARPARRSGRRERSPSRLRQGPLLAIAASLLMACLGLSGWVAHLRRAVEGLSEPRINVVVRDLYLADSPRGPDEAGFNQVPAGEEPLTLILNSSLAREYAEYLLTIEVPEGAELWRRQGLRPSRWNTFTLVLPGGFLPAGEYRLRLFGLDQGRWQPIECFPLKVLGG